MGSKINIHIILLSVLMGFYLCHESISSAVPTKAPVPKPSKRLPEGLIYYMSDQVTLHPVPIDEITLPTVPTVPTNKKSKIPIGGVCIELVDRSLATCAPGTKCCGNICMPTCFSIFSTPPPVASAYPPAPSVPTAINTPATAPHAPDADATKSPASTVSPSYA